MKEVPISERRTGLWSLLQHAGVYDGMQALLGAERWRKALVLDHVNPRPGERILDLGCGTGALRRYVRDAHYLGIDRNPAYIAAAAARYPPAEHWRTADVADLAAMETGSFDVVMGAGLLHHLDDDTAQGLLRHASTLLRPGGRLAMLDPVFIDNQHPVARWMTAMDRGKHVRHPDGYRALLETAFTRVDIVIRNDLLRLPYDHAISTGALPRRAGTG